MSPSTRHLEEPAVDYAQEPVAWRLTVEPLGPALLVWSLLGVDPTGRVVVVQGGRSTGLEDVRSGLSELALSEPQSELSIARKAGGAVLPASLRTTLLEREAPEVTPRLTVATRGWPATLPWEAMALDADGDVRLVERCAVLGGLSPALTATRPGRGDDTPPPASPPGRRGLALVDPGPLVGDPAPLYPGLLPGPLLDTLADHDVHPDLEPVSADRLATLLGSAGWDRFLYFGHVRPGSAEVPAEAALVLAGGASVDLLTARDWLARPDRWPSPPRVAIIGCGSDDTEPVEQSGLVTAAMGAGAQLVTVTRWILPHRQRNTAESGSVGLLRAVAQAHRQPDPVLALRHWQNARLTVWRQHGPPTDSPLFWASPVTYPRPTQHPLVPAPAGT